MERIRSGTFGPEAHGAFCAERGVDDETSGRDVEGFVRVFGDVVCSGAVELDQSVVQLVAGGLLGGLSNLVDGRGPGEEGEGFVRGVAVDWLAAVFGVCCALAADEAGDLACLVMHSLPGDFLFEFVEEAVQAVGGEEVVLYS